MVCGIATIAMNTSEIFDPKDSLETATIRGQKLVNNTMYFERNRNRHTLYRYELTLCTTSWISIHPELMMIQIDCGRRQECMEDSSK